MFHLSLTFSHSKSVHMTVSLEGISSLNNFPKAKEKKEEFMLGGGGLIMSKRGCSIREQDWKAKSKG